MFFDFAPLLCIPLYQQLKPHEYIYKDNVGSNFNCFEHEVVANRYDRNIFKPLKAATDLILKTRIKNRNKDSDDVEVTSHSFQTFKRVDMVSVMGGDGRLHAVPVEWIEYVPVQAKGEFSVSDLGTDDEYKFKSLGRNGIIYARGLVSTKNLNVDINELKSLMSKD